MTLPSSLFTNTSDHPDLDEASCVERLSGLLAFRTERGEHGAFAAQARYLEERWPKVFAAAELHRLGPDGDALLLVVPGRDRALAPYAFLSHQDVVPVVPGTEGDWTHPPFSGHVDETYVWGRGSVDMKSQLAGTLEALSYVIEHEGAPLRDTYVCLGNDEETTQLGSVAIAEWLAAHDVHPEVVFDEGDYLVHDAAAFGAPGVRYIACCVAEKGYVDLKLSVKSEGGHSSNPFGGTSLERLARAITRVACGFSDPRVTSVTLEALEKLEPSMEPGRIKDLVSVAKNDDPLALCLLAKRLNREPETFPLTVTTVAPTMIEGSSTQPNVMPQDMSAVINFRILAPDTIESVEARVAELVADCGVTVERLAGDNEPSRVSRTDTPVFSRLSSVVARYFADPATGAPLAVLPALSTGATDAKSYEGVCDSCLRCSVFVATDEDVRRGVHGTDERIERVSYMQGIRALITFMSLA
jgi:carboxypeptidase PM20D1